MNALNVLLIIAVFLIVYANSQFPHGPIPDTAGKNFRYTFTRNAHFNQNPYLKFYFVNQDKAETAVITVSYISIKNNQTISSKVSVPFLQFGFHQLNAEDLIWQYICDGMQRHPNTVIFITSTVPIRLYATNFDLLTNQTDTVTVLPDTMADKNYIITLPTASRRIYSSLQYHIIHFLPINFEIPTKIIIKISYKINKTVTFELTTTNSSKYIHYFAQSGTVSRLPRTYYIEASQPILITTALTCTPILSTAFAPSGCDFAAFMPPPIFKQDCNNPGYDISGSNTFNTKTFYISPPIWSCNNSEEQRSKLSYQQNDGVIIVKNISSKGYQPGIKVLSQDAVTFESDNAMLQINRLGGIDLPDTVGHAGAYLTHVPSGSEMLTGIQYFFILSEAAIIEIISSTPDVIVDEKMLSANSKLPNPFGEWHFFKHSINDSQKIHFIYTVGNFAVTVIGYHPNGGISSYGYEIAYNKQQYGGKYSTKSTSFSTPSIHDQI